MSGETGVVSPSSGPGRWSESPVGSGPVGPAGRRRTGPGPSGPAVGVAAGAGTGPSGDQNPSGAHLKAGPGMTVSWTSTAQPDRSDPPRPDRRSDRRDRRRCRREAVRQPVGREGGAGDPAATRPWTSMRRDRDRGPSRGSPAAPIPRRTDPRPTSSAAPAPPAGDLPPLNGHGKGPFFRDTRASLSRSHADAAYCPVDSGLRARDDVQPKEDGLGRAGPHARAISLFSRDPDHRIGQRTGVH